ncbi:MAG: hypothetical protein LUD72_09145 [Bacteroidales bacterium]|nr:hypothetical protein [Bacteroidales bacterium]
MAEKKLSRKKLLDTLKNQLEAFETRGKTETEMNDEMFNLASEYGFTSDHGVKFSKKYCNGEGVPTDNEEELKKVLAKCDSWKELGSLYFSYWREITHFDDFNDPFDVENVIVFVAIIGRLVKVLEKKDE